MKILLQARGLELGIGTSQIVAGEVRIGLHPAAQQAAAQRAVGERCNVLVAAIGQDADTDRPNLARPMQLRKRPRRFLDRRARIWPMNLIEIDDIGTQPTQ
jgi:hypothetical protein